MVRVVIVDDEKDSAEILSEYLEMFDINVVGIAHDGNEGIKLCEQQKPDVVVTDIMMPIYDGFHLIENLRKEDPSAKIIVTTADVTTETENKLKNIKPDVHLKKPFELEDLRDAIKLLANGKIIVNY